MHPMEKPQDDFQLNHLSKTSFLVPFRFISTPEGTNGKTHNLSCVSDAQLKSNCVEMTMIANIVPGLR